MENTQNQNSERVPISSTPWFGNIIPVSVVLVTYALAGIGLLILLPLGFLLGALALPFIVIGMAVAGADIAWDSSRDWWSKQFATGKKIIFPNDQITNPSPK